jgi:hypothetical protein
MSPESTPSHSVRLRLLAGTLIIVTSIWIASGETVQGFVHCEQFILRRAAGDGQCLGMQFCALQSAAMPDCLFAAGIVDQDPAHRFGGGGKEVASPIPGRRVAPDAEPGFMHQRGRLEGLTRTFLGHAMGSQSPQVLIDQRQQLLRCPSFPSPHGVQNTRHLVH